MHYVHRVLLDHLAEAVPQVQSLAGGRGYADGLGHPAMAVDVPPRHGVFHPGQAVGLQRLAEADDLLGGHESVPKVIDAE